MKLKLVPFLMILLTAVCAAQLFLLSTPSPVTALPPRPTATAVPTPALQVPGAQIVLQFEGDINNNVWTIVQWQDAQSDWHDVTGWQGTLDTNNTKTWWVGEEELGTGPFCWLVVDENEVVRTSDPFNLPALPFETLTILVNGRCCGQSLRMYAQPSHPAARSGEQPFGTKI